MLHLWQINYQNLPSISLFRPNLLQIVTFFWTLANAFYFCYTNACLLPSHQPVSFQSLCEMCFRETHKFATTEKKHSLNNFSFNLFKLYLNGVEKLAPRIFVFDLAKEREKKRTTLYKQCSCPTAFNPFFFAFVFFSQTY